MGDVENKTMPDRNRTYTAIWQAVKSGKIKRGKCAVCGASKTQAHHTGSYKGTRNLRWLCDKHHRAAHVRLRKTKGGGYKKSEREIYIAKADNSRRLIWMIVAKPRELDTDEQWFEAGDVELMAHRYLVRHVLGESHIFEEHEKKLSSVFLVQSYIAPVDFVLNERRISEGTWVVVLWIPNDDIWEKVKTGKLRGASPRGPAKLLHGQPLS